MAKLIVIAGIKRSGSTWMYNAVRLCLEHAGYSVHIAGDGQFYQDDCKADYQIIKVHPFVQWMADRADYVFTSDRDDEGIRESWKRFRGEELTEPKLQTWRVWLDKWNQVRYIKRHDYGDTHMHYASLSRNKGRVVGGICSVLGIRLSECAFGSLIDSLEQIEPPNDKDYDPVTLLFSNHITSQ